MSTEVDKAYLGQSKLRITLQCGENLTTASNTIMKYEKPSGETGEWSAGISDAAKGTIFYDVQVGDLDEVGFWKIWAYVTFQGGGSVPGSIYTLEIVEEGK